MKINKTVKIIISLAVVLGGVFGYYLISSELNQETGVTSEVITTSASVIKNIAQETIGSSATTTQLITPVSEPIVMPATTSSSLPATVPAATPATITTTTPATAPITAPVTPPTAKSILVQKVPFSPQSPFGQWSDLRQEDGCEEMSVIMAMRWVNKTALTPAEAEKELFAIADFETKNYGYFADTSAQDTADRIFKKYFSYNNISVIYGIDADDIINELKAGNIVLVPVNGKTIGNPNYKNGGPERHFLLIKGYDLTAKEFITNDPGTRKGENYRYDMDILVNALRDYPSGTGVAITDVKKAMISVRPK